MVETTLKIEQLDQIINKYQANPSMLIQILLEVQRVNRWLPAEALNRIAQKLNVPFSRIYQIATFYKAFSLIPKGRNECSVCMGTACHVRGSPRILDRVQDVLGIKPEEITQDMKFSLETVNCLGCCAMGPVVVIDGKYHSKVSVSGVERIIQSYD